MSRPAFPIDAETTLAAPEQRLYDPESGAEYVLVSPGPAPGRKNPSSRALTEAQMDRQVERGGKMPDGFGFIPDPEVLAKAMKSARLPSIRVFWYLAAHQPWNSLEISYDLDDMARHFGRGVDHTRDSVTYAIQDGLIFPVIRNGRSYRTPGVVAMNPLLFWRGFARERQAALQRLHSKGQI